MDINVSVVNQRVIGILTSNPELLSQVPGDENKKKSAAFVLICMSTLLDIPLEEAAELLTEGGQDAGVDGLHISDVDDGEFIVTLFQGKYKINNLDGNSNFPENGVEKAYNTVELIFDPYRDANFNPRLKPRIEEIRSLISDGFIPAVRVILCNNGIRWNDETEKKWINTAQKKYKDKLEFVHFNHDCIVDILQKNKSVDTTLSLTGKISVEDMNFMRVMVGRLPVEEIHRLFSEHGNRLLERNIRRYLGLSNSRVNSDIYSTLLDKERADKFYFYNNGITIVCDKFDYNALQSEDYKVRLTNMQIINGGQTCKTIYEAIEKNGLEKVGSAACVMIRVYQLAETDSNIINEITYATNNQNPVDLRDLHSNDNIQKILECGLQGLGYTYKRQRDSSSGTQIITSPVAAEAVLAIWRECPHQAKFQRRDLFGKFYKKIFQNLTPEQLVLAVIIFRAVENERKRPTAATPPLFLPYASHYLSMLIGKMLLEKHKISLPELSHINFNNIVADFENNKDLFHEKAVQTIDQALKNLYGDKDVSLQQLAATFRRGDLLRQLGKLSVEK